MLFSGCKINKNLRKRQKTLMLFKHADSTHKCNFYIRFICCRLQHFV
jgi:hypothetical protein